MSSPRAVMTSRTRAASSRYGPFSGKPATTGVVAPAQVAARSSGGRVEPAHVEHGEVADRVEDHDRSPTAGHRGRPTRTVGGRTPATTCALVTTTPSASTQPLPSCEREQDSASPGDLDDAAAPPAAPRRVWPPEASGGSTGRISSGPKPSKTRGKPSASSSERKPAKTRPVWDGITWSIAATMCDCPTARDRDCDGPPAHRSGDQRDQQRDRDHAGHRTDAPSRAVRAPAGA